MGKNKKLFLNTNKINGTIFRAFRVYPNPFFNDGISVMQPRFGGKAARSLCKSRGSGDSGHGSWLAAAGGCR